MKNIILILNIFVFAVSAYGQQIDYNTDKDYIANGYDVVSYFSNDAKKGKKDFTYEYDNVSLRFYSQANLDAFKANPEKYMPAYGGWCAYAMGVNGEKVTINPKTYEIRDGKLLLFYNSWGINTLKKWNKEGPENLAKTADTNWAELKFKD